MYQPTTADFKANARRALADDNLRGTLGQAKGHFVDKRRQAVDKLPEFDALCDAAVEIKTHTLAPLDVYLEAYEARATAAGAKVHWAATPEEACAIIGDICRAAGAKTVTKGKTMIAEEIDLNDHLEADGLEVVETDLGEYIIQLRRERPSHIIAPAVHVTKDQVAESFFTHHTGLDPARKLEERTALLTEARQVLRQKYFQAEVGITGANYLIAETGTSVIVTNEGNGDLTQLLPKVHVVLASIDKVVPTLEDATTILRVLARSATGQEYSVYTTFSTGPRRAQDPDGPEAYHVVILDNGRSSMLGGPLHDMLRCIRCGACMNHCPVYQAVGGHAYGWVYVGPMGAVLSPAFLGIAQAAHLPGASTFCGRCEEVCPMRIPLPKLMRHWREQEYAQRLTPFAARLGLRIWAFFALRPGLYHWTAARKIRALALAGRRRGHFRWLPFAAGWTGDRDFPAPEGATFQQQWAARRR